jgi:hypothetical protein
MILSLFGFVDFLFSFIFRYIIEIFAEDFGGE